MAEYLKSKVVAKGQIFYVETGLEYVAGAIKLSKQRNPYFTALSGLWRRWILGAYDTGMLLDSPGLAWSPGTAHG